MFDVQSKNFQRVASRLFEDTAERAIFADALAGAKSASPALIRLNDTGELPDFGTGPRPEWLPNFISTVHPDSGAGSHALHESGVYYCLDLSSVFQGSPLLSVGPSVESVVDFCASPGGKSILAWRIFHPALLVCNEVIGKRLSPLIANLERCSIPSCVTNADAAKISEALPDSADLVLVDAPCSGQSLMARGIKAPSCFHPATINMNSNRQKRIIANAGTVVRPGGRLLYTTCTFSVEENEGIARWFLKKFPEFEIEPVERLEPYRTNVDNLCCYRLYPQRGEGAGGFTVLFRKQAARDVLPLQVDRLKIVRRTCARA